MNMNKSHEAKSDKCSCSRYSDTDTCFWLKIALLKVLYGKVHYYDARSTCLPKDLVFLLLFQNVKVEYLVHSFEAINV